MYRNEKIYVRKLLAALTKLGVSEIPFSNDRFQKGIEAINTYYIQHASEFGEEEVEDIDLLFLRRPIEGTYDEFADVMLSLNGSAISFALKNPYYEIANIQLSSTMADYYLQDDRLPIDESFLISCAEKFCKGADVKYSKEGASSNECARHPIFA